MKGSEAPNFKSWEEMVATAHEVSEGIYGHALTPEHLAELRELALTTDLLQCCALHPLTLMALVDEVEALQAFRRRVLEAAAAVDSDE